VIGVVGGGWRAHVTPWGAVVPDDGSPVLDWWVAADDRWHTPAEEPACRQRRIGGTPVVETALRVPGGDAVQCVYAVGHDGGLTVVEIENRSASPFAVVVSRPDLLTTRPPVALPIMGVDLPPYSVSFPVAHRTTIRLALAHDGRGAGRLPAGLPTPEEVVRGWTTQTATSTRLQLPDASSPRLAERLTARRADLLLDDTASPDDDPAAFVVGCAERARLGPAADSGAGDLDLVAAIAERLAKRSRRASALSWTVDAALIASERALAGAGETRAANDVRRVRSRLPWPDPTPVEPPDDVFALAWVERRVALDRLAFVDLFPAPFPNEWLGQSVEGYGLPVAGGTVGIALRWHGERPALLWDTDVALPMRCSGLDPAWSTTSSSGEALLSPVRRAPR
jgi:hypothetical protein